LKQSQAIFVKLFFFENPYIFVSFNTVSLQLEKRPKNVVTF